MSNVKYNFVIDCSDETIEYYSSQFNVEVPSEIIARPDLCWCLQSYLILRKKTDLQLLCSNKLRPDCINIVHSAQLLKLKGTSSHFITCVKADFPRREWAHYHLVQNKNQILSNTSYIPFWITPGLIKRDITRKGVRRIAYAGQTFNGNLAGTANSWEKLFEKEGLEFVAMEKNSWHDLSSIDVLIGIRSFDSNLHDSKPPSKLINAWHANIPFIGGYDSAYVQVGSPGVDYLRVKTPQETLQAVLRLKNDPKFYTDIVQKGSVKAIDYTTEKIAKIWEQVLLGPVFYRFEEWKMRPKYEWVKFNSMLDVGLVKHQVKQIIKTGIGLLRFVR